MHTESSQRILIPIDLFLIIPPPCSLINVVRSGGLFVISHFPYGKINKLPFPSSSPYLILSNDNLLLDLLRTNRKTFTCGFVFYTY